MKIEEKFEDDLYGEMYGLIYFFIEEMSGCRGEEEIRKICRQIYKNRKKLGLFTLDDIGIDEEEIVKIIDRKFGVELMFSDLPKGIYQETRGKVIKAISNKKPIKIILDKNE